MTDQVNEALLGKLRCLAVLLQQLNAQTACAAVNEAAEVIEAAHPSRGVVDEAMVERGAKAAWEMVPRGVPWRDASDTIQDDWVRIARVILQAAQPAVPEGQTWADGVRACISWVEKRRHDFESEFGSTDPDTGAMEFRSVEKEEYVCELGEIEEGLRRMLAATPKDQPAQGVDGE